VNGYREEGTTTTPFDMLVLNGTSRYDLVQQAVRAAAQRNPKVSVRAAELVLHFEYLLREFTAEIRRTAEDPSGIRDWRWSQPPR
jgi:xylulose-5-phosphate/fructose-6-phosphate phosphoketolase